MIISKLTGGLGNQMFQYAAGLSLAHRHDVPLRLDLTHMRLKGQHQGYQLDQIFKGDFQIATKRELLRLLWHDGYRVPKRGASISSKYPKLGTKVRARERSHNYDPDFQKIGPRCYLSGYWQTEKYFAGAQGAIRDAFVFANPPEGKNADVVAQMQGGPAVSLHIRRGDYVTNAKANAFHGLCDWDYYDRAVAMIRATHPDARFFVFSDDPAGAADHFGQDERFEVIAHNTGADSYLDMMLMTYCDHHIIANSSFSWWGAWLARTKNGTVIAPKVWFAGAAEQARDICADGWVTA